MRESKILQRVKCVGNLFVGILQDVTKWKEWNRMKTKNHRIVPKHIFVPILSLKNRNNLIPNWFILYCKLESGIYQISEQGWNKHFHQNMSVGCPTTQRYKMFGTNNTLWGIVNHKVAIFFSEKRYWFPIMLFPYSGITAYMNPPVAYKYGPYADLEAVYGVWRFYRNSYFIPPPIKIRSYG